MLQEEFIKQEIRLDWDTAQKYHAGFYALYPGVKPYWHHLGQAARAGNPVKCPTGGYFWNFKDALRAANGKIDHALGTIGNVQVQAVESRLTMRAGLKCEAEGILPRLVTYDGMIAYADERNALDAARFVRYAMEEEAKAEEWMRSYPFPVDVKTGVSWGELEEV